MNKQNIDQAAARAAQLKYELEITMARLEHRSQQPAWAAYQAEMRAANVGTIRMHLSLF